MKLKSLFVLMLSVSILYSIDATAQNPYHKRALQKMVKGDMMFKKNGQRTVEAAKNKMIDDHNALAVVGVANAKTTRLDIGKRRAIAKAKQEISSALREHVKATTHDFMEMVGVDDDAETNDVFNEVVDVVTSNLLNGAHVVVWGWNQNKAQKKKGTATFSALVVISPKATFNSLVDEIKKSKRGSKENLYQRYMDSKAKVEHEKQLKEFEEKFGI